MPTYYDAYILPGQGEVSEAGAVSINDSGLIVGFLMPEPAQL